MEQDDEIKSGCLLFPPAGGNMFSKFPKKVQIKHLCLKLQKIISACDSCPITQSAWLKHYCNQVVTQWKGSCRVVDCHFGNFSITSYVITFVAKLVKIMKSLVNLKENNRCKINFY